MISCLCLMMHSKAASTFFSLHHRNRLFLVLRLFVYNKSSYHILYRFIMNLVHLLFLELIIGNSYAQSLFEWSVNNKPELIEDCLRKSIHYVNFQPVDEINLADASNILCETKIDNGLHIRITFDYQDRAWQCFLYKSVIQILTIRFDKCKVLENEELIARAQRQQTQVEKENEVKIDELNKPIQTNPVENFSNRTELNSSSIVHSIGNETSNNTIILADGDTDDELIIDNESTTAPSTTTTTVAVDGEETANTNQDDTVVQDYLKLKSSLANHLAAYGSNVNVMKEEDIEP